MNIKRGKYGKTAGKILKNKKAIAAEELIWMLIAVAILAVCIIGYIILKSKGISAIDYIKNFFRFG